MAVTILKAVVVLVIGFVLLVKGADFFVEGASSVAKMLKVPSLIIGMTIVAMGTGDICKYCGIHEQSEYTCGQQCCRIQYL